MMNRNYIAVYESNGFIWKRTFITLEAAINWASKEIAKAQQTCKALGYKCIDKFGIYHFGQEKACYCASWND